MTLANRFPPLYECSECGTPVTVTPQGEGVEPIKRFGCPHTDAVIWANRKVTLRGVGTMQAMGPMGRARLRLTMTVRQLLCALTGRSV